MAETNASPRERIKNNLFSEKRRNQVREAENIALATTNIWSHEACGSINPAVGPKIAKKVTIGGIWLIFQLDSGESVSEYCEASLLEPNSYQ